MFEMEMEALQYGTGGGPAGEPTRITNRCLEKCIDHVDKMTPIQHQQVVEILVATVAFKVGHVKFGKAVLDGVRKHMAQIMEDLFEGAEH